MGAAAEGLRFHSANGLGMSFALTVEDDEQEEEEEEDYYPTPIRTIEGTKNEEEDRGMVTPKGRKSLLPSQSLTMSAEGSRGRQPP